jgi:hypothetical protein
MNNSEIIEREYAKAAKGLKEEWLTNISSKWYEYIIGLPIHLQITYLVVVFHNQIFNGGFHQYFVNGYGQFASETIKSLVKIGAQKKAELLKKAFITVNAEHNTDIVFRKRLLEKDINPLFVSNELFEPLDKLDSKYYACEQEDIELLLSDYLRIQNL